MSSPMTKPCLTEMKQGSKLFYSVFRPSRMYSPDEFSVYQKNKCLIFPLIQLPSLLKLFGSRGIYVLLILARFFIPRILLYGTKKRGLCCSLSSVGIGKRLVVIKNNGPRSDCIILFVKMNRSKRRIRQSASIHCLLFHYN